MLDCRPTAYLNPIAEQEFTSLTPLIRMLSAGDEDCILTGLVRIYRISTGLLIYSSELAVTEILSGETKDVAALTPWSPPAPADDDYQIVVNCNAVSHPPEGWHQLSTSLPAYTFDIKPIGMGPAPAAHAPTHENGGSDPLEIETLPTSELDDTLVLAPDGAGGVTFVSPAVGGNIETLPTAEMDDTLVLAPDGAGGVEFRAPAAAGAAPATFELFVANGTWTKPAGAKLIYVECVGPGGGGGGGTADGCGGGGGGGGALVSRHFPADALPATVPITVPAGGAGGAAGVDGAAAATTKFGNTQLSGLWAFGGGGAGFGQGGSSNAYGGSGAGSASAGTKGGVGGLPGASTTTALGNQGAAHHVTVAGVAEFGGGAGGNCARDTSAHAGGGSLRGGPGGGSGGAKPNGNGADGGAYGTYTIGASDTGGGAGSGDDAGAGSSGSDGDGYYTCGNAGDGGGTTSTGNGGAGGNGGNPGAGGGGGGGAQLVHTGGTGGTGGRGEVRIWVWF